MTQLTWNPDTADSSHTHYEVPHKMTNLPDACEWTTQLADFRPPKIRFLFSFPFFALNCGIARSTQRFTLPARGRDLDNVIIAVIIPRVRCMWCWAACLIAEKMLMLHFTMVTVPLIG